jgi:hypothetical protein
VLQSSLTVGTCLVILCAARGWIRLQPEERTTQRGGEGSPPLELLQHSRANHRPHPHADAAVVVQPLAILAVFLPDPFPLEVCRQLAGSSATIFCTVARCRKFWQRSCAATRWTRRSSRMKYSSERQFLIAAMTAGLVRIGVFPDGDGLLQAGTCASEWSCRAASCA